MPWPAARRWRERCWSIAAPLWPRRWPPSPRTTPARGRPTGPASARWCSARCRAGTSPPRAAWPWSARPPRRSLTSCCNRPISIRGGPSRRTRGAPMRLSTLLAPDLEETLRTNPAHAAELAEELHAVDLAELLDGLADEQAVLLLAALPITAAAAALDVMDHVRREQLFAKVDRGLAARIADSMSADERADLFQ